VRTFNCSRQFPGYFLFFQFNPWLGFRSLDFLNMIMAALRMIFLAIIGDEIIALGTMTGRLLIIY